MVFTSIKQRRNRLPVHSPLLHAHTHTRTDTPPHHRPTGSSGRKAVSWLAKGTRNGWDESVDADGLVRWLRRGAVWWAEQWGRKLLNGRVDLHLPRWLLSSFLLSVILPENSCGSWVPASAAGRFLPIYNPWIWLGPPSTEAKTNCMPGMGIKNKRIKQQQQQQQQWQQQ